jgi:DNA repair protein RecO (recombination protein O)
VSALSREHGKIKVVAKGVRRPNSPLLGVLEPGNEVELLFYPRKDRELWTLSEASLLRAVLTGASSLDKLSYLLAALELADRLLPEREPDTNVVGVFRGYLRRWHEEGSSGMAALFFALETRLLWNLGLGINLGVCGVCGAALKEGDAASFRPAEGDLSCPRCSSGKGQRMNAEELYTWRALDEILNGEEAMELSDQQRRRIGKSLHLHMSYHLPQYRIPKALFWLSAQGDERGGER